LSVFTFDEPINDISHGNIIQEPLIDLTFENLFEELMCLEELIRDILVNYTPPRKSVDLCFKEIYGTELEFLDIHSEEVPTKRCDGNQFLNNGYRHLRKKSLERCDWGGRELK